MAKVNLTDKYSAQVNNIVNKSTPKTVNPYNQQPINQVQSTVKPLTSVVSKSVPQVTKAVKSFVTAPLDVTGAKKADQADLSKSATYFGEAGIVQPLKSVARTVQAIPSAITLGTSIKPEERKDTVTIAGTEISTETPTYDPYNQSEQYRNIKSSLETQYGSYENMPENTKAIYENVVNSVLTVDNFGKTFEEQITNIQNEYADKPIPSFMQEKLDVLQDQQLEYTAKVDNARQKLIDLQNQNIQELTDIQEKYQDVKLLTGTEYASKVSSTIIQMTPYILASYAGGGIGGAVLGSTLGSTAMYATVYTNASAQALQEGATDEQANTYAHMSALIETGTEALFGGVVGAPKGILSEGVAGMIEKGLLKSTTNGTAQILIKKAVDVFGEGAEEYLAEYLGSMAMSIYTQDERSLQELNQDAIDSFIMGAITSGVMQVGRVGAVRAIESIVTDKQVDVENIPLQQANEVMNAIVTRAGVATSEGLAYRVENLPANEKGYYDASTREIVLNKKEVDQYGLIDTALPHEMTHALEGTKAYQEMADFILQSKQEEFDVTIQELRELYQAKFDQVHEQQLALGNTNHTLEIATNETMAREMIAEYIRNNFASRPMKDAQGNIMRDSNGQIILYRDYNALLDLAKKPTIVSALKKTLQNFVLKSKLADAEGTSKEAFLQAQAYFESLDTFLLNALKNAPQQAEIGLEKQIAYQLTKEQEEFFKDSKARDEQGNLINVYHGSNNYFTTPLEKKVYGDYKFGDENVMFFTDNLDVAKSYQQIKGNDKVVDFKNDRGGKEIFGGYIYSGYLNIKNPLVIDAKNKNWNTIITFDTKELLTSKNTTNENIELYKELNGLYIEGIKEVDDYKRHKLEKIISNIENNIDLFNSKDKRTLNNQLTKIKEQVSIINKLGYFQILKETKTFDKAVEILNDPFNKIESILDKYELNDELDIAYGYSKDIRFGMYNNSIKVFNNDVETNDIINAVLSVNKKINNKYDSIIFNNVTDAGGYAQEEIDRIGSEKYKEKYNSTVIATIGESKFKDFQNLAPTTSPDIRYSLELSQTTLSKNTDSGFNVINEYETDERKFNDTLESAQDLLKFSDNKGYGYNSVQYGDEVYTKDTQIEYKKTIENLSTDVQGNLTTSDQEQDFTVRENGQLKVFYYNENGISKNALNYGYFLNESSQGLDNVKQVYVNANVVDANGSELQQMDLSKYDITSDMTNAEIIKSVGDKFGIEEVTNLLNEITQNTGINALQFDNALMVFNKDQYSNIPERVFRDDVAKIEYKKVGSNYQINEYNEYNDLIHSELMTQDEVIENVGQFAYKVLTNATNQFNVSDAKPDNSKVTTQQVEFLSESAIKNEDGSPKHVYHGSPNVFESFSYQNMGTTGLVDGVGFYFTDNKEFASGFSGETGKVYDVFLNIKKPTDETSLTITKEQLKEIMLDIDSKFDGDFLNNYDDVSRLGKEKVVNSAVNEILKNYTNDRDIINGLMDTVIYNSDSFEPILRSVMDKTGIDGFVTNKDYGTLYIPFVPEQIVSTTNPIPQAEPTTEKITYNDLINEVTITDAPTQSEYKALERYFDSASQRDGVNIYVNVSSLNGATDGKIYTIANTGSQIVKDIKKFYSNIQYSLEQEAFFKDSITRDEQGNLVPVYHGTRSGDFTVFDKDLISSGSGNYGYFGDGFYFNKRERLSEWYGKVKEYYINIKNPFSFNKIVEYNGYSPEDQMGRLYLMIKNLVDLNSKWGNIKEKKGTYKDIRDDLTDILDNTKVVDKGINEDGYRDFDIYYDGELNKLETHSSYSTNRALFEFASNILDKKYVFYNYSSPIDTLYVEKTKDMLSFGEYLKSIGYDGVIETDNFNDTEEIVVFDSNQIKEVTNLNPTLSPDIRYSLEKEREATRSFQNTAMQSNIRQQDKDNIQKSIDEGKFTYTVIGDEGAVQRANERINTNGIDKELNEFNVKFDSNLRYSKDDAVVAMILINKLSANGRGSDVQELLSKMAILDTESGQFIQASSIIKKLDPAGQLRTLTKTLDRVNRKMADSKKGFKQPLYIPQEYQDFFIEAQGKQVELQEQRKQFEQQQIKLEDTQREIDSLILSGVGEELQGLQTELSELRALDKEKNVLEKQIEKLNERLAMYSNENINFLESDVKETKARVQEYQTRLNEINKNIKRFNELSTILESISGVSQRDLTAIKNKYKNITESNKAYARLFGKLEGLSGVDVAKINEMKASVKELEKAQKALQKLIDKNARFTSQENINEIMEEAKVMIAKQLEATWFDKLNAFRYLSMLGNPRTHIRNVLGNTAMIPLVMGKNVIATTAQQLLPQEQRTKALFSSKEAKAFAKQDFETYKDTILGDGKYTVEGEIAKNKRIFNNFALEWLRTSNSNPLEKEDEIFAGFHYRMALASYLTAQKVDFNNINEETLNKARDYAIQEARKATFRDASQFANKLSEIQRKGGVAGLALDAVIPFKKTPINIIRRGVEYSPIGLFKSLVQEGYNLATGRTKNTTEFIENLSAGLTGTGIAVLGVMAYAMGMLELGGDDDEEKRLSYLENAMGRQRYSINILGGTYTIDWLSPAVMPFIVGAEMAKTYATNNEQSVLNNGWDALLNIMDPVFELTMLQGVTDTLSSFSGGGIAMAGEATKEMIANYANQFIPTLLGQIARTVDPIQRSTLSGKQGIEQWVETTVRKIANKIPYASTLNAPVVNVKGEIVSNDANPFIRAFNNLANPGYYKETNVNSIDNEIMRLYDLTNESGVLPRIAPKSITVNGEKTTLDNAQYSQFQENQGQTSYNMMRDLINTRDYQIMADSSKMNIIEDVYEYAYQKSKENLLGSNDDKWYAKVKLAERAGLKATEYLILKDYFDTISVDDISDNKGQITRYINENGYGAYKNQLLELFGYKVDSSISIEGLESTQPLDNSTIEITGLTKLK